MIMMKGHLWPAGLLKPPEGFIMIHAASMITWPYPAFWLAESLSTYYDIIKWGGRLTRYSDKGEQFQKDEQMVKSKMEDTLLIKYNSKTLKIHRKSCRSWIYMTNANFHEAGDIYMLPKFHKEIPNSFGGVTVWRTPHSDILRHI